MTKRRVQKGEYKKYALAIQEGLTVGAVAEFFNEEEQRVYYVLNYYGAGVRALRKKPVIKSAPPRKPLYARFIDCIVGIAA